MAFHGNGLRKECLEAAWLGCDRAAPVHLSPGSSQTMVAKPTHGIGRRVPTSPVTTDPVGGEWGLAGGAPTVPMWDGVRRQWPLKSAHFWPLKSAHFSGAAAEGSGAFLATLQGAHHQVSSCLECSAERVRATVSGRVRARVLRVPDADRAL